MKGTFQGEHWCTEPDCQIEGCKDNLREFNELEARCGGVEEGGCVLSKGVVVATKGITPETLGMSESEMDTFLTRAKKLLARQHLRLVEKDD